MAAEKKTVIEMPELNKSTGETAQLQLTTDKYSNSIVSSASVVFLKDGCITFEMFGDFRKTIMRSALKGTQKNIDTQHAEAFTEGRIDSLKAEARVFYERKRREEEEAA